MTFLMFLHFAASAVNNARLVLRHALPPKPSARATVIGWVPQNLEIGSIWLCVPTMLTFWPVRLALPEAPPPAWLPALQALRTSTAEPRAAAAVARMLRDFIGGSVRESGARRRRGSPRQPEPPGTRRGRAAWM